MIQASLKRIKTNKWKRRTKNNKVIKFCNQYNQLMLSICSYNAHSQDLKALCFFFRPHTLPSTLLIDLQVKPIPCLIWRLQQELGVIGLSKKSLLEMLILHLYNCKRPILYCKMRDNICKQRAWQSICYTSVECLKVLCWSNYI